MEYINNSDNGKEDFHDNSSLSDIQLQLSTSMKDFDSESHIDELFDHISDLWENDTHFRELFNNEKNVLKNVTVLNTLYYKFVTNLPKKRYKLYLTFTVFCDFFELPYDRVFNCLSDRIQRHLDASLKKILGKDIYQKYYKKHKLNDEDIVITTIFDLD